MEHRTTKEDLVPPWYKRGSYIMILGIIAFIAVYAIYLLFFAPKAPPPPAPVSSGGYSAPPEIIQALIRGLGL